MKTPTTMFVLLFSYLLIDLSAVSADSTCPDPIDRTTVRDFQCIVRTETGIYGGSDNDIYLKLFDTSGRQTDWYYMHNQNNVDFRPNTTDSFTMIFTQIAPDIHFIEIKEYYDPWWWLISLELYCPDVKIDMRFPRDGYIIDRDQQLVNKSQPLCPERGTISNGTMTCSDDTKWGSVCHYKCDSVIVKMKGPECVYCQQNGTWSAPVDSTTCVEIGCPTRDLTNGKVSCTNGLFFQSTCTYACNEGFVLRGLNSATCLLTGHWSVDLPTCEAIVCPQRSLTDGKVSCSNGLFFDSTCTYKCDEGFLRRGSASATCLVTGLWSDDLPRCEAVMCPSQGTFTNGTVQCTDGTSFDSVCKYTCDQGFTLIGSRLSTCKPNGSWRPKPPICAVVHPEKGLGGGAIAGIAVGIVAFFVIAGIVVWLYWKQRESRWGEYCNNASILNLETRNNKNENYGRF